MNISVKEIYDICSKEDKMFSIIFDLPSNGCITLDWRWVGMGDGNIYRYSKAISSIDLSSSLYINGLISEIADERNWR